MEEKIVESSKGGKMSIQSCLERQAKNIDYGKDDVDKKWGQIDTLPEKIQNVFLKKLEIMQEIMTKHKLSSNYSRLNSNEKSLVIDILQEFVDNFIGYKVDIKAELNNCIDTDKCIKGICTDICKSLWRNKYLTEKEFTDSKIDGYGNEFYKVDDAESKAKDLITKLPSSFSIGCLPLAKSIIDNLL